jgi:hypothetical protein
MTAAGRRRLSRPRSASEQALTVLLAIAAFVAAGALGIRQIEMTAPRTSPVSDDEIYTGSILFPSEDETRCHQLLFDNRTGQFKDNGSVDCQKAYYRSTTRSPMQWSSIRAQVISESFRRH